MKSFNKFLNEKKKNGLWDNIHAKRRRGEKPNPPGHPDRPTAQDFKNAQKTSKEEYSSDAQRKAVWASRNDEKKKAKMKKEEADSPMCCKHCGDEFGKPTNEKCMYDAYDPKGKNWVKKESYNEAYEEEPASPDEKSMAMRQAKFIQYVGDEIMEHLEQDGDFPEWMQNKLSEFHQKAKDMHSTMSGSYKDNMDEAVQSADKKPEKYIKPDGKVGIRMIRTDKKVVDKDA